MWSAIHNRVRRSRGPSASTNASASSGQRSAKRSKAARGSAPSRTGSRVVTVVSASIVENTFISPIRLPAARSGSDRGLSRRSRKETPSTPSITTHSLSATSSC